MTMFENKRAWIDHEMEKHWRSWSCYLCKFMSNQQSDVESHLVRSHPEVMSEGEHTMIYISSRPLDYIDTSRCMLCDWDKVLLSKDSVTVVSRESFMGHLAHHLEQLALFAVPRINSGEDSGSLGTNHAANQDSQVSESAESPNFERGDPLIDSAIKADHIYSSSYTQKSQPEADAHAVGLVTIAQAFPLDSQGEDATLTWMTGTDPRGPPAIADNAEEKKLLDPEGIVQMEQEITDLFAKTYARFVQLSRNTNEEPSASHQELGEAIQSILLRLSFCKSREGAAISPAVRHALDDYVAVVEELQALVDSSLSVNHTRWDALRTRVRALGTIQGLRGRLSATTSSLAATLMVETAYQDLPKDEIVDTLSQDEGVVVTEDMDIIAPFVDTEWSKSHDAIEYSRQKKHPNDMYDARHKEIWSRLWYPGMSDRELSIGMPLSDTFQWIFGESGLIDTWLCNDDPLLWISGKHGCGKSTMMRMIDHDIITGRRSTPGGSDHKAWYVLPFYFCRMGSALQNSVQGLLRFLLYRLVRYNPYEVNFTIAAELVPSEKWTTNNLDYALEKALRGVPPKSLILIVDGLDECEDDPSVLIDLISRLRKLESVKICIASRPWTDLSIKMERLPDLLLDAVSVRDITILVERKLAECAFKVPDDLTRALVGHCQGSFLEAERLVHEMKSTLKPGADERTLRRQVDYLVSQMEAGRLEQP
jgi:hypothetical protein